MNKATICFFYSSASRYAVLFAQQKQLSKVTENRGSRQSAITYWSILKSFLHIKKIPYILPLFYQNKYVTDFKRRQKFLTTFLLNSVP